MRKRTIGMLVVAVLLAGVAARLVAVRLNRPVQVAVKKEAPKPSILVAARDLTPGQFLRADDLRWQTWPRGSIAPQYAIKGHVHQQAFVGRVLRVSIAAGEPVTDAASVAPGDHGFLAAVLKPGMRAISVPVTATTGVANLISPGDWVDLILTEGVPGKSNQMMRHAGLTILRNIRVIALDQDLNPTAWKAPPVVSLPGKHESRPAPASHGQQTATLEVTPQQVQAISVAEVMGTLSLSLRGLAQANSQPAEVAALDPPGNPTRPTSASLDPMPTLAGKQLAATGVSYTLDSQVSPLLPPFPAPIQHDPIPSRGVTPRIMTSRPVVTVLRGSANKTNGVGK